MTDKDNEFINHALLANRSSEIIPITPDTIHPYPANEITGSWLNNSGIAQYHHIPVGEYGINTIPLASFGFLYCSAVILRPSTGQNIRGLAHVISGTKPDVYIEGLQKLFNNVPLEAIIIESESKRGGHFAALPHYGVRVIEAVHLSDMGVAYLKDVIVLPKEKKILVNPNQPDEKIIPF